MTIDSSNTSHSRPDWSGLARDQIKGITPYVPGKPISEVKREYGLEEVIKMASNENPLGASPKARQAIEEELDRVHLYPDGASRSLVEKVSQELEVEQDMLTFGNGSDGLLKVIAEAFLDPESRVVISHPTFVEYNFVSQLMGCQVARVWMSNYRHNLQGMLEAITPDTRMVFLPNPDNPAGTIVTRPELTDFLDQLPPEVIVVLDQAYQEYVEAPDYPDGIDYVKQGYPVITLRTFSKIYGLAGLRLGYAISTPGVKEILMKARDPFNVNRLAEKAGRAALDDRQHLEQSLKNNRLGKEYLYGELDRLGLDYVPTETNFILVNVQRDSEELFEEMLKQGVIIRPGKPLGYEGHIRVTIGTPRENREFIRVLELTLD
ncbi:MAG: histidinol-phosphate transaminase [Bacillota bacterium]